MKPQYPIPPPPQQNKTKPPAPRHSQPFKRTAFLQHQLQSASQKRASAPILPGLPAFDDTKDDEARKLAEAQAKTRARNENIHFNFFEEVQYGIPNFPKTLSEIGILCSKSRKKALVIGCGAGRLVFEMAKHFAYVDGIDCNQDWIEAANSFKTNEHIQWQIPHHGDIMDDYTTTALDLKCDKRILQQCHFAVVPQLHSIPLSYKQYDCIITLNVLDKLTFPKRFVNSIQRRVNNGGVLIFSECFNWKEDTTMKSKWIGGTAKKSSADALKEMLLGKFTLIKEDQMSFVERQNAFLFKLCIANTLIFKKL